MRKQQLTTCAVFSLLSVCCSCSMLEVEERPGTSPGGGKEESLLEVNMGFVGTEVMSRAIYDGVATTAGAGKLNKIKLMIAASENGVYADYDDANVSAAYTAEAKPGEPLETVWKADADIYLNNNKGLIYAWAPVDGEGALTGTPAVAAGGITLAGATVPKEQTFDATAGNRWKCSQTDYLFGLSGHEVGSAKHDTVSKIDRATTVYMHHALAKVSFKVMKGEGQPAVDVNDYVKQIKLASTANDFVSGTGLSMSLVDGTLTAGTSCDTLVFTAETGKSLQTVAYADTYASVTSQVYGLIAPLTNASNVMSMKLTLGPNDGTTDKDRIYETGNSQNKMQINWERGKEYIYTVKIADKTLDVALVQIVAFEPEAEQEFPVE